MHGHGHILGRYPCMFGCVDACFGLMFSLPVTISHHSPLHIDLFFEVLDWEDHLRHWTLGIFEAHAGIRLLVHCEVERIAHVVGLASLILCVLFTQNRVLLAIFSLI